MPATRRRRIIRWTVIAVAAAESKAAAILGAARTGCIDVLVIDERTAAALVALV